MRILRRVVAAALVSVCAAPCLAGEPSREEVNTAIAHRLGDAVNRRDLDALDAIMAPDVVRHSAATPGVVVTNLEQFKEFLRRDFATVPDSVQEVRMTVAEGNLVAVYATYGGTQAGPMGPFPATGRRFELPFVAFLRFEDERIAEMWVEWDNLSALTQLDHLPAGPPGPMASPGQPGSLGSIVLPGPSGKLEVPPDVLGIVARFETAWNANDPEAIVAEMTDDAEYVEGGGRSFTDHQAIAGYAADTFASFSDFTLRTIALHPAGDHFAWEWVIEGTHDVDWPWTKATGRSFSVPGVSIVELRDGKIRRIRDYWDHATLFAQLGVAPPAPSP